MKESLILVLKCKSLTFLEFIGTANKKNKIKREHIELFIIKLYSIGFSLRDIEKVVGMSFMTVKRILEKHGVKRRK